MATAAIHREYCKPGAEQNHSAGLGRGSLKADRGHRIDFARPIGRGVARTAERVLYLRVHPGRQWRALPIPEIAPVTRVVELSDRPGRRAVGKVRAGRRRAIGAQRTRAAGRGAPPEQVLRRAHVEECIIRGIESGTRLTGAGWTRRVAVKERGAKPQYFVDLMFGRGQ